MTDPVRLAVYSPSPVYYQAPLYRRIAADPRVSFTAIFGSDIGVGRGVSDGYGQAVDFAIPVLDGYESIFLAKASRNPAGGTLKLRDWDISAVLRRSRFDALWLHGYNTITHILAAATQRSLGLGLLVREEQTLLNARPAWKRLAKHIGLRLLLRNAYALYIGTENRRWFAHWGVPDERLFFAPYTVDNERLRAAARELMPKRQELRRAFGLDDERPVILSVGRFVPKKQPLLLLRAFDRLLDSCEASLLLVGSGPLENDMRAFVDANCVRNVVFAGFLDQRDVASAYAAADVLVLASGEETWGLVVNEAMNFGLPVVATDMVGSATDLITNGENGFVIPAGDADALRDALQRLAVSQTLRRAFGQASLNRISDWNDKLAAEGVLAAVRAAVSSRRAVRHIRAST